MEALSQAQIDAIAANGRELLRRQRAAAPSPVNVGHALELGQPLQLDWRGQRLEVRQLSYRDGLQLIRAQLVIGRMEANPPSTVEEIEDCEAAIVEMLALFHDCLADPPAANPFGDATPQEVGHLLGFFLACQMRQGGRSAPPQMSTPHPSMQ